MSSDTYVEGKYRRAVRFHPVCGYKVSISDDRLRAEIKDPSGNYGGNYGAKPLRGTSSFEAKIMSYSIVAVCIA